MLPSKRPARTAAVALSFDRRSTRSVLALACLRPSRDRSTGSLKSPAKIEDMCKGAPDAEQRAAADPQTRAARPGRRHRRLARKPGCRRVYRRRFRAAADDPARGPAQLGPRVDASALMGPALST